MPGRPSPRRVADHEAAHAVIAHVVGFEVTRVHVGRSRDRRGHVLHGYTSFNTPKRSDPLKEGIVRLAGSAAEFLWHGLPDGKATMGDLEAVRRLGFRGRSVAAIMALSRGLVRFYRRDIRGVSRALQSEGRLDRAGFRRACALRRGRER